MDWKLGRVWVFVAGLDLGCMREGNHGYGRCAPVLRVAVRAAVLSPLAWLAVWTVLVVDLLRPYYADLRFPLLAGGSVLVLGLQLALLAYGFMHWRRERYRPTRVPRVCFLLAALLLAALLVAYVVLVVDTYESLFVVLVSYNLVPALANAHLASYFRSAPDFPSVLRLRGGDPAVAEKAVLQQERVRRVMVLNYAASLLVLGIFAALSRSRYDTWAGAMVAIAVFYADMALVLHFLTRVVTRVRTVSFLTVATRVSLFAFGRRRWFLGVSVNYVALGGLLAYHLVRRAVPVETSEGALDRVVGEILTAIGGTSGGGLAKAAAAAAEVPDSVPEVRVAGSGSDRANQGALVGARRRVLSAAGQAVGLLERLQRKFPALGTPRGGLALLTAAFAAYTAAAAFGDRTSSAWGDDLFPRVRITDEPHPQYAFGVFAAVLTLGLAFALAAFRVYEAAEERYTRGVLAFALAYVAAVSAATCVTAALVDSSVLLVSGLYLPALSVALGVLYAEYRANGYCWNSRYTAVRSDLMKDDGDDDGDGAGSPVVELPAIEADDEKSVDEPPPRAMLTSLRDTATLGRGRRSSLAGAAAGAARGVAASGRSLARATADFVRCRLPAADYRIAACLAAAFFAPLVAGLHAGALGEEPHVGGLVTNTLWLLEVTFFMVLQWLRTFTFAPAAAVLAFVSVVNVGVWLGEAGVSPAVASGFTLLYPGAALLAVALVTWRDNRWKVNRGVLGALAASAALFLGFGVSFAVELERASFTVSVVLLFFGGLFLAFAAVKWSLGGFWLPAWYRRAALAVGAGITAAVVLAQAGQGTYWFVVVSTLVAFALAAGAAYVVQRWLGLGRDSLLFPSRWVFPVYRYDSGEDSVRPWNGGHAAAMACAVLAMVWGATAALLLDPSWPGWAVFGAAMLFAWGVVLQTVHGPARRFWKAWLVVAGRSRLVDEARRRAIDRELQQAADAMDEESGGAPAAVPVAAQLDGEFDGGAPLVEEAEQYLASIRRYWEWEEHSKLGEMLARRREIAAGILGEGAPLASNERVATVGRLVAELGAHDKLIRRTFEEQSRAIARFMAVITLAAPMVRRESHAAVKNFLRFAAERQPGFPNLAAMGRRELEDWVALPENAAALSQARARYLDGIRDLRQHRERLEAEESVTHDRRSALASHGQAATHGDAEEHGGGGAGERSLAALLEVLSRPASMVDADHDRLLRRVRRAVAEAARRLCQAGQRFEDARFPPPCGCLGPSAPAVWSRPAEGGGLFAGGEPRPEDVVQGAVETCYLLSAAAVVARTPGRVRGLVVGPPPEHAAAGVYAALFFRDGLWRAVAVDSRLAVAGPGQDAGLVFARSDNPLTLWVAVLEKAYAKMHGGYDRIAGGLVQDALVALTGGAADEARLDSESLDVLSGALWARIASYHREGFLMGCGNPRGAAAPGGAPPEVIDGIVQGHAYAVLDVRHADGVRLVKLFNPFHNEVEWRGEWSDHSAAWTTRMAKLLGHRPANDGVFWMSFADVVLQFRRLYVCRVFDVLADADAEADADADEDYVPGGGGSRRPHAWHRAQIRGEWRGHTAGGCPGKGGEPERNPQFELVPSRTGLFFVSLAQQTRRDASSYPRIGVFVLRKDPDGRVAYRSSEMARSEMMLGAAGGSRVRLVQGREVTEEVTLEAGVRYTVFCTTYLPLVEAAFTLSVYCRRPFALRPLPEDAPVRGL